MTKQRMLENVLSAAIAATLVFLSLVLSGCSGGPPETVSLDSEFSEAERETILSAIDAWGDAVGWRPRAVLHGEGRYELVGSLKHRGAGVVGFQKDGVVQIAKGFRDLAQLWFIAAHETGHFCTDHTPSGLMAERHNGPDVLEIDDEAVRAWKEGCP